MLTIQNLSYSHPAKNLLFSNISLTINANEKIALIGNNGVEKSTLLKIIAGDLQASDGVLKTEAKPYYIPQIFGQFNQLTIAEALQIDKKIVVLHEILDGNTSEDNYDLLNDDWDIEERCAEALNYWQLSDFDLAQKNENAERWSKNESVFICNFHSSAKIDIVGRTE